jgi:hypothetical protein
MKKRILILLVMMVVGQFLAEAAITVTYQGSVVDAASVSVPDGNEVRIGYFDNIGGFEVATVAPTGDWAALQTHWHQFAATTTPGFSPLPGGFAATDSGDGTDFYGKQIYLWAFKTTDHLPPDSSWNYVVEYGIFLNPKNTAPDWGFPIDTAFTVIDSSDTGVMAYYGDIKAGSLQLAAVPEPGACAAATGVGLLLFSIYRKLAKDI